MLKFRSRQILYIIATLVGAVFVLVYRGPLWPYVRGYMGDWLVVQFIYLIARFWVPYRFHYALAAGVFLLGVTVEIFQLLATASIPRTFAAEVTIGSTFDPVDIATYALGVITIVLTERWWMPERYRTPIDEAS
jgi:hypothetical protein